MTVSADLLISCEGAAPEHTDSGPALKGNPGTPQRTTERVDTFYRGAKKTAESQNVLQKIILLVRYEHFNKGF